MNKPLVSIACTTYNHEQYIAQALESFLMQKTAFPIEIVINDDASTDGTARIIKEYANAHANIKAIFQKTNQYSLQKKPLGTYVLPNCTGKYIALCEGDDFWTDPLKLQKQVQFLEENPDYTLCFHNGMVKFEDSGKTQPAITNFKEEITIEDLIRYDHFREKGNFLVGPAPTASAVFRNGIVKQLPQWFFRSMSGDMLLYIFLAEKGKARFLNEMMSVYRIHAGGVSSQKTHSGLQLYMNRIEMYHHMNNHFDYRYDDIVQPIISRFYVEIVKMGELLARQDMGNANRIREGRGAVAEVHPDAKSANPAQAPVRILLIQAAYPTSPFPPHLPIGLGSLAQQLEDSGIAYDVLDLNIVPDTELVDHIVTLNPEYIGYSMMSLDLAVNYGNLEKIRAACPDIKIIVGDPHIGFVGAKALETCTAIDYGIMHEGEQGLVALLQGASPADIDGIIYRDADTKIRCNRHRGYIQLLDELSFPRYTKFDLSAYGNVMQIASSRGCPHQCTFCGASLSMGKKWRARSAENIVTEIEYWYSQGYGHFNFVDSNFFLSKRRVNRLCDALEKRNIRISISVDGMRLDDAEREMLQKMKKFGLRQVSVGIESANDDTLTFIKKGLDLQKVKAGMDLLMELDIKVSAFFVLGLPGETVRHVINSFKFVLTYPNIVKCHFFNINPLPGTELFQYARDHKLILGSEEQLYQNIGGMGNDILMASPDLSLKDRHILLQYSKVIARAVEVNHLLYEQENGRPANLDCSALRAEAADLQGISQKYLKLLAECRHPQPAKSQSAYEKNKDACLNGLSGESGNPVRDGAANRLVAAERISTHMTREEKQKLFELAGETEGKVFVEVGSYLGASACYLAEAIQAKAGKNLYCVDTWKNDAMSEGKRDTYAEFQSNTRRYGGVIVPMRGVSAEVAKNFEQGVDFLFLDADHSYEGIRADVNAWFPKLNAGALVVFHDIGWAEGVQKAVQHIDTVCFNKLGALPNMCWGNWQKPHGNPGPIGKIL